MSIREDKPLVVVARDQGTQNTGNVRVLGRGMLIGALGLTYPADIVIHL